METDIKLSQTQLSRIISSRIFPGALPNELTGPLMKVVVSLAKKMLALQRKK